MRRKSIPIGVVLVGLLSSLLYGCGNAKEEDAVLSELPVEASVESATEASAEPTEELVAESPAETFTLSAAEESMDIPLEEVVEDDMLEDWQVAFIESEELKDLFEFHSYWYAFLDITDDGIPELFLTQYDNRPCFDMYMLAVDDNSSVSSYYLGKGDDAVGFKGDDFLVGYTEHGSIVYKIDKNNSTFEQVDIFVPYTQVEEINDYTFTSESASSIDAMEKAIRNYK